jgi:hypothetical protein
MSLSDLYSALHNAQYQVRYWTGSANTYHQWAIEAQGRIDYYTEQLRIANGVLGHCTGLPSFDETISSELNTIGTGVDAALQTSVATLVIDINKGNDEQVDSAITATQNLITELEAQLAQAKSDLAYDQEGESYSWGRVDHYEGECSSIQYAIDHYDDDDD